ncbi:MAG: HDOD domain-containing protein [Desulfobacterales bacterium]|nr:HDOD domain-containing protein [Desulfobacterales bacterium]
MPDAKTLLKNFKNLKTLPHIGLQLTALLSDDNTTIHQIEELIRLDPTLILRLLRLVNSPYYGLREKVTSISQAIVFIGMKNLRNMVVVEALRDIYKNSVENQIFSRTKLWMHCAVVSISSQMISERVFNKKGEDAFLCGILHDIGMIVEDQIVPNMFIKVCESYNPKLMNIIDVEKEIIGTDHAAVGNILAIDWKLPVVVQDGIKNHHKVTQSLNPESIEGIIQISEYLSAKLNYTAIKAQSVTLSPPLVVHMGKSISEYKTIMKDLPDEIKKAKDIYQFEQDA